MKKLSLLGFLLQFIFYYTVIQGAVIKEAKLHDFMTDEEIFATFRTCREKVPEYVVGQLITPPIKETVASLKSSAKKATLVTPSESIDLALLGSKRITYGEYIRMYETTKKGNGYSYQAINVKIPASFGLVHDRKKRAAVSLEETPHGYLMSGAVADMRVLPLPRELQSLESLYEKGFNKPSHFAELREGEKATYHIIRKRQSDITRVNLGDQVVSLNPQQYKDFDDNGNMINHLQNGTAVGYDPRHPPPTPATVFPQMLITIDYDTFKNQGNDLGTVALYQAAFWNSINLQYKEITNPNISPNILSIVFPKSADVWPRYNSVVSYKTIQDTLKKDIVPSFPKDWQFDMIASFTWRTVLESSILGIASVGRACARNLGHILVADQGDYHAESSTAHEMGHSLSCVHDGETPMIKGPEVSAACQNPKDEGYMMSPTSAHQINHDRLWSQCSVAQLRTFVRKYAQCTYNDPGVRPQGPASLPGQRVSRDQQCKNRKGNEWRQTNAQDLAKYNFPPDQKKKYNDVNNCRYMYCMKNTSGGSVSVGQNDMPPLDGSSCGSNKICISGNCVNNG